MMRAISPLSARLLNMWNQMGQWRGPRETGSHSSDTDFSVDDETTSFKYHLFAEESQIYIFNLVFTKLFI